MPPATPRPGPRARARTRPRCTYVEGGRRCRRSGGGTPPLCQAHWLVVQDDARPGRVTAEVLRDILNGKRPPRGKMAEAAVDLLGVLFGAGRAPAPAPAPQPFPWGAWQADMFPPRPQPRAAPRQPPPPPPPPVCQASSCPACMTARRDLGFKARQQLTVEIIKAQHRKMARKHHPDLGGKTEDMQRVNAAVEQLLEDLR